MKKILLIIAITLCIFQMVVLATEITMGNPAIAAATIVGNGYTIVDKKTPANGTGTITTVELWSSASATTAIVATFSAAGNVLTSRDFEAVGAVVANFNSFEVTLDVVEGDYLGIYINSAQPEATAEADTGLWYKQFDQTQESGVTFSLYASSFISLKGTGTTEAPPAEVNAIFFGMNF